MNTNIRNELRWRLRFPEPQESLFIRDNAERAQRLVRHSFPFAALIFLVYWVGDYWTFRRLEDPFTATALAYVAVSVSLVGAWAWRTRDALRLVRVVQWVLATSGLAIGLAVARSATLGDTEPYGVMAWHMVYVFFLSGLLVRAKVPVALVTVCAYLGAKIWFSDIDPWEGERIANLVVLLALGAIGARILELSRREHWKLTRELHHWASHDGLTGLLNRRAFFAKANDLLRQARRESKPLSIILLDIDHFKRFNDARGHMTGDHCLRKIANLVAAVAPRPLDAAARFGGEEFLILLYACEPEEAAERAEALRRAIRELEIPHPQSPFSYVTASIGVSGRVPRRDDNVASLVAEADQMLYSAKHEGRNRVQSTTFVSATEANAS